MFKMNLRSRETRFLIWKILWRCDIRVESVDDYELSYVMYVLEVLCVTTLVVYFEEFVMA